MNETTIIPTTCVMDCPDTCALEVEVHDDTIHRIGGSKAQPTTNGFICDKVARFARRAYHPHRLLYPMRRVGPKGSGQFQRIGWDEAIAQITVRVRDIIRQWGGEAILPYHYGGSNGFLTEEFLDDYYFAKLGASRLAKTLCAGPATEVAQGMYGKMPGVAFEDFASARFILIWGANPKVSNIHLMPFIRQAKKNGAFVAVIDPVKNFSSQEIDLHLPIWPGTDLPIALAMIRLWKEAGKLDTAFLQHHAEGVEPLLRAADAWSVQRAAREADVAPQTIERLAEVYAASTPAVIRCGWGTERNRNGGQAIAAILAMPALLGKFGVRGGGYTLSNSGAARLDRSQIFGPFDWQTRIINMSQLGQVLTGNLQPPIQALFVYNCNPAVTVPDQNVVLRGLAREDLFTVVFEQVMTDTALYADILLPATTFLEHHDIKRAYGNYVVGGVQPVIAPRGEAKSNIEVFAALGRAMGWTDELFHLDAQAYMHRVAAALSLYGKPADAATLTSGRPHHYDFPGRTPIQFQTVFPLTPDRKIHLTPTCLGDPPFHYQPVRNERFPLAMISPATSKMITSTMGEYNYPALWLTMHPTDAAARAICHGDQVRVFNELGEVICRARVSDKIRPGVVSMPKGAWRYASGNGLTATALAPAHVSEVGGGACYNDARVEVEKRA